MLSQQLLKFWGIIFMECDGEISTWVIIILQIYSLTTHGIWFGSVIMELLTYHFNSYEGLWKGI